MNNSSIVMVGNIFTKGSYWTWSARTGVETNPYSILCESSI